MKKKYKFGELLVKREIITEEQLEEALLYVEEKNVKIGQALVELKITDEKTVLNVLSSQLRLPILNISEIEVDQLIVESIPERIVREHECFPFGKTEETIKLLVKDPFNLFLEDEIFQITGKRCDFFLTYEKDIDMLIDKHYEQEQAMKELDIIEDDLEGDFFDVSIKDENSPIIKITNSIFKNAVNEGVSDIHIGISEHSMDVRYRIDGILQRVRELPKKAHPALVSRIKTMADMDITDKRTPQDGRIQINLDGKSIDMRVSTLPSVHGEKLTIRILDKENLLLDLKGLGFQASIQKTFEKIISKPVGIILITGPTGSGKSTTLYTVINELNDITKNIITIEDPVEYKLDGIVQVQVNPKAGLTFAGGLKSILRQDPDIILVGEIRDAETANIAVKASTTGHLVFATLHTNDAVSTITRLVDMGVEPYLIAGTVQGVVNQRLVRRVCSHCKESYISKGFNEVRAFFGIPNDEEVTLYRGKGCEICKGTGYKGRVSIQELLIMDDITRQLIVERARGKELQDAAIENGMITMKQDGYEKALQGLTTLEEVIRFVEE